MCARESERSLGAYSNGAQFQGFCAVAAVFIQRVPMIYDCLRWLPRHMQPYLSIAIVAEKPKP